jgi:hypothetical protein
LTISVPMAASPHSLDSPTNQNCGETFGRPDLDLSDTDRTLEVNPSGITSARTSPSPLFISQFTLGGCEVPARIATDARRAHS